MYTPFLSDLVNDTDYMRISDTESSIVIILSQKSSFKSWKRCPKIAEISCS